MGRTIVKDDNAVQCFLIKVSRCPTAMSRRCDGKSNVSVLAGWIAVKENKGRCSTVDVNWRCHGNSNVPDHKICWPFFCPRLCAAGAVLSTNQPNKQQQTNKQPRRHVKRIRNARFLQLNGLSFLSMQESQHLSRASKDVYDVI